MDFLLPEFFRRDISPWNQHIPYPFWHFWVDNFLNFLWWDMFVAWLLRVPSHPSLKYWNASTRGSATFLPPLALPCCRGGTRFTGGSTQKPAHTFEWSLPRYRFFWPKALKTRKAYREMIQYGIKGRISGGKGRVFFFVVNTKGSEITVPYPYTGVKKKGRIKQCKCMGS